MVWGGILTCTSFLAPVAACAASYAARASWRPSADASVSGYRVYAGPPGGVPALALDAGMPAAAADRTLAAVVPGLDPCKPYSFAVTAYRSNGSESALSNEMNLGVDTALCTDPGPCATIACNPQAGCQVTPLADGTLCDGGATCAVCAAGVCTTSALSAAGGSLSGGRTRVTVRTTASRARVLLRASFPGSSGDDLTSGEFVFALSDGSGALVVGATVPGSRFTVASGGRFVYRDDHRREGGGFTAILVKLGPTGGSLVLRSLVPTVGSAAMPTAIGTSGELDWSMRTGSGCIDGTGQCTGRGRWCR